MFKKVGPATGTPIPKQSFAESYDWLTINVWTPTRRRAKPLPVMVWFYGGAYAWGSTSNSTFDAYLIAREQNLVVATCNYRVGIERYLRISGAPNNRGLLDQIAALTWVRYNIGAFGGDPAKLTI